MSGEDKSRIDKLNSSLYSRTSPLVRAKRHSKMHQEEVTVKTDWEHPSEIMSDVKLNDRYIKPGMSFFNKFLIGSFIFFVCSVAIGLFFILNGSNIVSADNVDISITGPISVAGGEEITFDVQVYNKNSSTLELVDLVVEYPSGTVDPNDTSRELSDFRQKIDNIPAGGISQKSFNAIIYGEENKKKEILVRVEYKVTGSNAAFKKEKIYDVLVSSSPVALTVDAFKEITSNQDLPITLTLRSNSKEVIRNVVLKAVYPFGFKFDSSTPKTSGDNNTWKIGDLPPGGTQKIVINGTLEGQDEEERVFRFSAGAWNPKNNNEIGAEYIASAHEVTIKKPFISLNVSVDGNSDEAVSGSFNDNTPVEISWFNNLNEAITDAEIRVKLSGTAYDKRSVSPGEGLFRSADDEIVWNKQTIGSLGRIEPGEGGDVKFNITPRDLSTLQRAVTNPEIAIDVSVSGRRVAEGDVPETVKSGAISTIKVASSIGFRGDVVRSTGPFANTGPVPPEPEKVTTYTVIWTVSNSVNEVTGATVRANLPPYVKWVGAVSPSRENISYNEDDGSITWNVGTMNAYTGSASRRREVAFQISIEPSVSDSGSTLTLVGQSVLTAFDEFANIGLRAERDSLDTSFESDPAYKVGDEIVK